MFKKYFPPSGPTSTAVVVPNSCPPGLWASPEERTRQAGAADENASPATLQTERSVSVASPNAAEYEQMHVRVIALENLVVALLATATDHDLECAREMAAYIAPRQGSTPHPLTIRAAAEMVSMVDRALHFRNTPRNGADVDRGA